MGIEELQPSLMLLIRMSRFVTPNAATLSGEGASNRAMDRIILALFLSRRFR